VDDHQVVVESFATLLDIDPNFEVLGTALTATDGAELVLAKQPDVAVFDVDFPGRDSFDVVPDLMRRSPRTKIVFLTAHLSDVFVAQAVRMRVRGYLLKEEPADVIRAALKRVHAGEFAFSAAVQNRLVWDGERKRWEVCSGNPLCSLSLQQLAILRHLARGASVKEVAQILGRSEKSIDSHKYRIMHQLGVHDRVELCRYAIREGLSPI